MDRLRRRTYTSPATTSTWRLTVKRKARCQSLPVHNCQHLCDASRHSCYATAVAPDVARLLRAAPPSCRGSSSGHLNALLLDGARDFGTAARVTRTARRRRRPIRCLFGKQPPRSCRPLPRHERPAASTEMTADRYPRLSARLRDRVAASGFFLGWLRGVAVIAGSIGTGDSSGTPRSAAADAARPALARPRPGDPLAVVFLGDSRRDAALAAIRCVPRCAPLFGLEAMAHGNGISPPRANPCHVRVTKPADRPRVGGCAADGPVQSLSQSTVTPSPPSLGSPARQRATAGCLTK